MTRRGRHLWILGSLLFWIAGSWATTPEPAVREGQPGLVGSNLEDLRIRTASDRILRQVFDQTPHRDQALVVGERLIYSVRYGPIRAGEATLEIAEVVDHPQGPAYRLLSKARSNSFFDSFYKVDDHVESLMDVDFLFSRRHE
jgi:hypothetical protein